MDLSRTKEDCLESIYVLGRTRKLVRSVDVANSLGLTKPSVSVMLRGLEESGFVVKAPQSEMFELTLTEKVRALAEQLYERHCFFQNFLIWAGVQRETAEQEACALEHALSHESFDLVRRAVARQREMPAGGGLPAPMGRNDDLSGGPAF